MKKLFLFALACSLFAVGTANAQEENYYGPQKGSWAITVGADPVINFVGNMFNGTQRNTLALDGTLAGKYFVGDKFAVRAGVAIMNDKSNAFTYNPEDKEYKEVVNTASEGYRFFAFTAGAQYYFRPGKRLQPFVSADLFYGRRNEFTLNKSVEYTKEDDVAQYDGLEKTSSPVNTFGGAANVGIEFFLGKRVSLSGELGLNLSTYTSREVKKYESSDPDVTPEYIEEQNFNIKRSTSTNFGTSLNSNISFNFYF
ncbi:MAG: hypothetical protein IKU18_00705 [Bacteroidales bacterium]|nr:hypothetical protein [Bacteroidales bacterium]